MATMGNRQAFRCGYVALCGRPNVGKSTLLNRLIGQKLSIVSRKPHTTRWHILGIRTSPESQLIYMDLPGLRRQHSNALNRFMHREVAEALLSVDAAVFLVEALHWTKEDDYVLENLVQSGLPIVTVVNKTDRVKDKAELLPYLDTLSKKHEFHSIFPLSARHDRLEALEQTLTELLPQQPALFPEDQISDRHERFFVAELLREQLIRHLGQEVPYQLTVTIEQMREDDRITHINALIWVENKGQRAIVIGNAGERLKQIATAARQSMERFLDKRVNLKTWVKIREHWTDDRRSLHEFGYDD